MISPVRFVEREPFVLIDDWVPRPDQCIVTHCKGAMVFPVSRIIGVDNMNFDMFALSTKRCYNGEDLRAHTAHYINYFMNFFDKDKELLSIIALIKYCMDYEALYTEEEFIYDIKKYILSTSILYKVDCMNHANYRPLPEYKNDKNPSLQYENVHAIEMMRVSILMNILIPLITHFMYCKNIDQSVNDEFILRIFDIVLHLNPNIDIYNKLYETVVTNVDKNANHNAKLWDMQAIRSRTKSTHSLDSVNNIILNIMPKYTYNENIITFNFRSIIRNIDYQVTNIGYEYNFIALSASKRD